MPLKLLVNFGKFIQNARKMNGVTQVQFLECLGQCGYVCTQSMLSQIESGQISNPNKDLLQAFAKALKVEFDVIMLEFVADKYGWTPNIKGYRREEITMSEKFCLWVKE